MARRGGVACGVLGRGSRAGVEKEAIMIISIQSLKRAFHSTVGAGL
ncbi:MAG: hypothetical protein JWM74_3579, partial [Myxococcaceae bacterium]|nr:hypothetical protein [Myxococcaceae bacterium]